MAKTTFTSEELQGAFNDVITADDRFPEYPLVLFPDSWTNIWEDGAFPLTFRRIGQDENVTVRVEERFDGEEGGDHAMYIIFSVGYGDDKRWFRKTGEYSSWENSEWDGTLHEVVSQEVKKIEWVAR